MGGDRDLVERMAAWSAAGRRFALVTLVRTAGSTPRGAGAKMIVSDDGERAGTVGGGRLEEVLVEEARAALGAREPRLVRRHLVRDLGMCCGGEAEAFVDPMGGADTLVLVGAGHISAALAPIGARLGFRVVVVDEAEEVASAQRFPDAWRLVHAWDSRDWNVPLGDDAYVVVATRDHAIDEDVLGHLARDDARPAYLGVVGSRAKLARFRERLRARGVPDGWIEQVRGPIGVDIGAETPEEIAVAIAAEIVGVRRRRPARP